MKVCTGCHELDVVAQERRSRKHWNATGNQMLLDGAYGTDEEIETLLDYLAKYFRPPLDMN